VSVLHEARMNALLEGLQSALNAHGDAARVIAEIAWVLFIGGGIVFAATMALAAYAVFARREHAGRLSARALVIGGGIVFPVLVLSALLVYSFLRAGELTAAGSPAALRIEVIAEQWWWRVHYLDVDGRRDFATANEIRVPVGEPVVLELKSADVIHSFWVPALAGKVDMIPGRTNRLRVRAERAGRYRGQCAEYCGGPHAWMALLVVAEERADFLRWTEAQRRPARQADARFQALCAACHSVRGTPAAGTLGPDLTHVASRAALGAGVLPNGANAFASWIAASQRHKPGNLMPSFDSLGSEELDALAAYLESLE
jgi:cytochrome c oxidase subunit 2